VPDRLEFLGRETLTGLKDQLSAILALRSYRRNMFQMPHRSTRNTTPNPRDRTAQLLLILLLLTRFRSGHLVAEPEDPVELE